jgi:hypothetical protein
VNKDIKDFSRKVTAYLMAKIDSVTDKEMKETENFEGQVIEVLRLYLAMTGQFKTR